MEERTITGYVDNRSNGKPEDDLSAGRETMFYHTAHMRPYFAHTPATLVIGSGPEAPRVFTEDVLRRSVHQAFQARDAADLIRIFHALSIKP